MTAPVAPAGESDADILLRMGTDGQAWARQFCQVTGFGPEDVALGWFCNAIMAGVDESYRRHSPRYRQLLRMAMGLEPPEPPDVGSDVPGGGAA